MATPLLGLYAPADAADAGVWGSNWNSQGSLYLDNILAGLTTISLAAVGATRALTAVEARCQTIRFTGALSTNVTVSPDTNVLWNGIRCIENFTTGNRTLTLQNAGSVTIPQGRRGLLFLDATYGPRFMSLSSTTNADLIPAGYPMTFYAAAAPTGWTQVTSITNATLRIVEAAGGVSGGTLDFSTVFGRTTVGDTALTLAQIPSHSHPISALAASSNYTAGGGPVDTPYWAGNSTSTTAVGGGLAHNHAMDMRVKYADFVLAQQ